MTDTVYGMNTDTRANPHKYAERKFQTDDEFFNDALVLEVTSQRWRAHQGYTSSVSYRIIAGGFTPERSPIGSRVIWVTDTGLGHRHPSGDFKVVGHIIDNKLHGEVPAKSMPLYVFK